jgi:hypothetical protein
LHNVQQFANVLPLKAEFSFKSYAPWKGRARMLMRKSWALVLGMLLVLALGCKSHPELSKINNERSGEWKQSITGTHSFYSIKAGNRINTPNGDGLVGFGVSCDSDSDKFKSRVTMDAEPESGAVGLGFDDALSQKTWSVHPFQMSGRQYYDMEPSENDIADLVRQLRHAKSFQFEFTPKAGKPQRSNFKALNIGTLLDKDENCKAAGASVQ